MAVDPHVMTQEEANRYFAELNPLYRKVSDVLKEMALIRDEMAAANFHKADGNTKKVYDYTQGTVECLSAACAGGQVESKLKGFWSLINTLGRYEESEEIETLANS